MNTVGLDVPIATTDLEVSEEDQTRITEDGITRIYEDDIVEIVNL